MKAKNIFNQILGLLSVLLIVLIAVLYGPQMKTDHTPIPILEGWKTEANNCISTVLPQAFEERMTICFWSNHQEIQVYLEDKLLYDASALEQNNFCEIAPSRWNRIELPSKAAGKLLKIESSTANEPFVREYVYGTSEEINQWLHLNYGMFQLMDVGLVGVGAFFVLIAFINKRYSASRELPMYFGLTMILAGFLFRTNLKGIPIHWMSEYTREMLGYLTFFIMPICWLVYVKRKVNLQGWYENLCNVMELLESVTVWVLFLLHGLKIYDVSLFVSLGVVFWGILILLNLMGKSLAFLKEKDFMHVLSLISSLILTLVIPLEILRTRLPFLRGTEYGTIARICFLTMVLIEIVTYGLFVRLLESQKSKTEEENKKLQFQLMSSQIRPHFILNTLGAIRAKIGENAEEASNLLYDFSKYLRKIIEDKDYTKPIPFLEELDYIETYLRLEKTRFGSRLQIEYQIEAKEFWVLPLTIQPFVENAVKHGIFSLVEGGTICISSYIKEEYIVIEISDNGVGFDSSKLREIMDEKKSVGLRSAIYRIENEMRGKCSITSSQEEGISGTKVQVMLPK